MGIDNFNTWLKENYSTAVYCPAKKNKYDYIYIDCNHILHNCMFSIFNTYNNLHSHLHLHSQIYEHNIFFINLSNYLDKLFSNFIATKKIIIAVDGTSSYSKIILQRKRRQNININKKMDKLNSLHLTPGTDFMSKVDKYLKCYVDKLKNKFYYLKTKFVILDSSKEGEGELKLFKWLKDHDDNNSHLIIGNDADLVVLAMSMKPIINIYILIKYKNNYKLLSINKLIKLHINKIINCSVTIVDFKNNDMRLDFGLIAIMMGNDYLPKLKYIKYETVWNAYKKLFNNKNNMIFNGGIINIIIFKKFILEIIYQIPKQFRMIDIYRYNDDYIKSYLDGLLWCLDMYQTGKCQMYDYIYKGQYSISPCDLYFFLSKKNINKTIEIPKSNTKPLEAAYYPLLVMPLKARSLIPKKYQNLIDTDLKYLYEEELCKMCNILKNKLSDEYLKLRDTEMNNTNISKISKDLLKHRKKNHTTIFGIDDINKIVNIVSTY